MKNNTGDKSLNCWLDFFKKNKKSMTKFIYLLKTHDKSFLTYENTFDFDHPLFEEIPRLGFLEEDLKKILSSFQKEKIFCIEEKTRLILAIFYGANFNSWKEIYKDDFSQVFGKSLIEGEYEEYGIELEKVISLALKQELIEKSEFMAISVLRGVFMGNKYETEQKAKKLKKTILFNKVKTFLGI